MNENTIIASCQGDCGKECELPINKMVNAKDRLNPGVEGWVYVEGRPADTVRTILKLYCVECAGKLEGGHG
ncbi:MAG: hypothetical protein ACYTEQ_01290 [Planctomycetota bacterium]|jgi:hypothetical protein